MWCFFVISFLFVTSLNAKSQNNANSVLEIKIEEVMDLTTGEYSDSQCAIKGNNSLCIEDISEQIQKKIEKKLSCAGNDLMGKSSVSVGSRNSFVLNHHCELCIHTSSLKFQPTVLTAGVKKMYLVQTSKIEQRFDIQMCQSASIQKMSACMQEKENTSQETTCKQKYSEVSVLLYDAEKDILVPNQKIKYPAACVCVVVEDAK